MQPVIIRACFAVTATQRVRQTRTVKGTDGHLSHDHAYPRPTDRAT